MTTNPFDTAADPAADLIFEVEPTEDDPGVLSPTAPAFLTVQGPIESAFLADQAATLATIDLNAYLAELETRDPRLAELRRSAELAAATKAAALESLGEAFLDRTFGLKVQITAQDGSKVTATWPKPATRVEAATSLATVLKNAEARVARRAAELKTEGRVGPVDLIAIQELIDGGDRDVLAVKLLGITRKKSKAPAPRLTWKPPTTGIAGAVNFGESNHAADDWSRETWGAKS